MAVQFIPDAFLYSYTLIHISKYYSYGTLYGTTAHNRYSYRSSMLGTNESKDRANDFRLKVLDQVQDLERCKTEKPTY